jgi:hypothetical protein
MLNVEERLIMGQVNYCEGCGLMRLAYERGCPRCGGTEKTTEAPPPAVMLLDGFSPFRIPASRRVDG